MLLLLACGLPHCLNRLQTLPHQVVKGGHLTAAKEDAADAEEVARVRHKLWIVIAVLFVLCMFVW